jgi:hypothetical protein
MKTSLLRCARSGCGAMLWQWSDDHATVYRD